MLAALLALAVCGLDGSREQDREWFALGMGLLPAVSVWWPAGPAWARLVRGALAPLLWLGFYFAYVGYKNHPWFAGPETDLCDGPCYGWYSFENYPRYSSHVAIGVKSLAVGVVVAALAIAVARLWRRCRRPRATALGALPAVPGRFSSSLSRRGGTLAPGTVKGRSVCPSVKS